MPTIATFMQFLPAGFDGRTYRSTDATIYCVVEGRGTAHIGGDAFEFEPHDIFVAPSWCRCGCLRRPTACCSAIPTGLCCPR